MELFIRSQDRQELVIVNGTFHVQETTVNPHSHKWGILVDGRKYLGEYSSEKRALQVLDEIQKILMPRITLEPITKKVIDYKDPILRTEQIGSKTVIEEISTYVYEMPKK